MNIIEVFVSLAIAIAAVAILASIVALCAYVASWAWHARKLSYMRKFTNELLGTGER